MKTDMQWLEPWECVFAGKKVLELGCGSGVDSQYISAKSSSLIACDLNVATLINDGANENKVKYLAVDHSEPLPFDDAQFDISVASMTLHYFSWNKTLEIVKEISRVLACDGRLICRLNSTLDVNYGATGHVEIEPGLFNVDGTNKRFFTEQDIFLLFAENWRVDKLKHQAIDRYEKPKNIWEFVAHKI